MWIERLGLAPAIVVGQSLGGHTAFLLAVKRPELVRGIVVAEATPAADPDAPGAVREWLASWPLPFASPDAALTFFGGDTLWARAWAGGLERGSDGFRPMFEPDVMLAALDEVSTRSHWREWAGVRCPALIVRAGAEPSPAISRMLGESPKARLVEIPDAGHDLHLDQPGAWRKALEGFLAELAPKGV
jgi:pimeloyl-ACP methyl ester carboxylesterase